MLANLSQRGGALCFNSWSELAFHESQTKSIVQARFDPSRPADSMLTLNVLRKLEVIRGHHVLAHMHA